MSKKALIIRGGSMKGAFSVGAVETLYKNLGTEYFDVIYSNSVGIMQQVFYASKQIDNMLKGWTEYVPGKQMFSWGNLLHGKPIMNVDYLIDLYQSDRCNLDIEKLKRCRAELYCIVSDHAIHKPVVFDLKKEDVFQVMRATCAVPILYHKKVFINGRRYHDGSLTINKVFDQLIHTLLAENYEEIIIVINRKGLLHYHDHRVIVIEPSTMPLHSNLDTNRDRILKTIEQGRVDARRLLENKSYAPRT